MKKIISLSVAMIVAVGAREYPIVAEMKSLKNQSSFRSLVTDCTERSKKLSCYRAGVYILKKRGELGGIDYIKQSCVLGYGKACTVLGDYYAHGYYVAPDYSLAKNYYDKGCVRLDSRGCREYINIGTPVQRKRNTALTFMRGN